MGTVPWAFIFNALAADSIPKIDCVIIHDETRVVAKVVVEGFTKGTSGHIEEDAALLDPTIDLYLSIPDVGVGTGSNSNPPKAALRHDNERGHLTWATDSTSHTVVKDGTPQFVKVPPRLVTSGTQIHPDMAPTYFYFSSSPSKEGTRGTQNSHGNHVVSPEQP